MTAAGYYNRELSYLRETGAEVRHPPSKIAADWGCREACADPYVERMIEAFSFLARPYSAKSDAGFPAAQRLHGSRQPQVRHPTPSMAVVKLAISHDTIRRKATRRKGVTVPRDTAFVSPSRKAKIPPASFAAAGITLWPLSIGGTPDRRAAGYARPARYLPPNIHVAGALRITLRPSGTDFQRGLAGPARLPALPLRRKNALRHTCLSCCMPAPSPHWR
ncbi:type VI secretion system baseplate subunit TssF [Salmonella enterica subsp. enterica]|nr:type VI secretion system baseplate subunit TssF [Salmonella enterica subsp. enterica]